MLPKPQQHQAHSFCHLLDPLISIYWNTYCVLGPGLHSQPSRPSLRKLAVQQHMEKGQRKQNTTVQCDRVLYRDRWNQGAYIPSPEVTSG